MSRRPKGLILYALLCLGIALSLPVQIAIIFELSWGSLGLIWQKLTFMNYLVIASLLATAYVSWKSSYSLRWYATGSVGAVILNNLWVGHVSENYTMMQASLGSLLFAIFAYAPYLMPKAREALLNPSKRWWREATRHSFQAPVTVMSASSDNLQEILAFDISKTGIFIKSEVSDFYGLNEGDKVSIKWLSADHEEFERDAIVVRKSEAAGRYPRGLGLKFELPVPSYLITQY